MRVVQWEGQGAAPPGPAAAGDLAAATTWSLPMSDGPATTAGRPRPGSSAGAGASACRTGASSAKPVRGRTLHRRLELPRRARDRAMPSLLRTASEVHSTAQRGDLITQPLMAAAAGLAALTLPWLLRDDALHPWRRL